LGWTSLERFGQLVKSKIKFRATKHESVRVMVIIISI
jgi:hypothetical protein